MELIKQKYPFVLVNMSVDGIDTNLVVNDSAAYSSAVVKYLYDLGHREISFSARDLLNKIQTPNGK